MTPRYLSTVLLRVLAIWFCCSAVLTGAAIAGAASQILIPGSGQPFSPRAMIAIWLCAGAIQIGLGVGLFAAAPALARMICRGMPGDERLTETQSVRSFDLYRIAVFLLGAYILVQAIGPLSRATVDVMAQGSVVHVSQSSVAMLAEAAVLILGGGALAFGSRGLARFVESLGHSSENTPAQQFSLRTILFVVVCCALLLGMIRLMVR